LGLSAVPLKHEHFFTADGAFGSRDDTGNQADDGTYRLTNPTTVVISKEFGDVTFHFTADDTTLTLDPIIPDCVKARCFAIQWAVSMAYPGLKWNRTNGRDDRKARQQSTTTPTNAKAATKLFMLASRMLSPEQATDPMAHRDVAKRTHLPPTVCRRVPELSPLARARFDLGRQRRRAARCPRRCPRTPRAVRR
jgi:hypothetical protein